MAEEILDADSVQTLISLDLARVQDDGLCLQHLRLVRHFGVMLFCQQPDIHARFYYGNDSLALGRLLLPARGRVLDLCAGVGTQGLLCALTADHVVSVELQASVATLYAVNSALNGLEGKMELRIGNLLEAVRGESFERVCCNPPLLPIPDSLPYPLIGDGGGDGLAFTREILAHLPTLLTPDGACQIVGALLGNEPEATVREYEDLAEAQGLWIQFILPWREKVDEDSGLVKTIALTISHYAHLPYEQVHSELLAHYHAVDARSLYSFLLLARLARTGEKRGVTLTHHYQRGSSFWSV